MIIVGAGPAGMTAVHLLQQRGVNFQVIETADSMGGRTKNNLTCTDFATLLGVEWVHVDAGVLNEIVNDASINVATQLVGYRDDSRSHYYEDGEIDIVPVDDTDLKFTSWSWLDFFSTYLLPGIADRIIYNTTVSTGHRACAVCRAFAPLPFDRHGVLR